MNILIYFPYNLRTVEQQSVMEMLVEEGHAVFLLTTCEGGYLHDFAEKLGVKADAVELKPNAGKLQFYLANIKKLASVIKKNKIQVVIAHQQIPALIAGLLKKITNFKLLYIRHNSDEDYQLFPTKAKRLNRIANKLTPIKVAPSSIVEKFWATEEKVPAYQINRINYGYNFSQYEMPDKTEVEKIKTTYPTSFRIISIARLAPAKRHSDMFEVVCRLIKEGVDCKLICLGSGPDEKALKDKIIRFGMQDHIFLLGRKENIFDYIEAADVFLHLSSSEASNSAVKEVGLLKKAVIVCSGVGDFDDYIINGENGFLVSKESLQEEAYQILTAMSKHAINGQEIGECLYQTIRQKFAIENIREDYKRILNLAAEN